METGPRCFALAELRSAWCLSYIPGTYSTAPSFQFKVVTPAFDTDLGRLPSNPSTLHPTLTKESPALTVPDCCRLSGGMEGEGWARTQGLGRNCAPLQDCDCERAQTYTVH